MNRIDAANPQLLALTREVTADVVGIDLRYARPVWIRQAVPSWTTVTRVTREQRAQESEWVPTSIVNRMRQRLQCQHEISISLPRPGPAGSMFILPVQLRRKPHATGRLPSEFNSAMARGLLLDVSPSFPAGSP